MTVVNTTPYFLERPRLHQLSTGQELRQHELRTFLEPAGIGLVVGTASAIDLDARRMKVDARDGSRVVHYDTLVYGVGSNIDTAKVPGIAEHAHAFTGIDAAARLHADAERIAARGGRFVVCGGGLTGIEAATELAESFPELTVTLVSTQPPGPWLTSRAHEYLKKAFGRLGVEVRSGVRVEIRPGEVVLADGETVPFDGCVWAGGFTVPSTGQVRPRRAEEPYRGAEHDVLVPDGGTTGEIVFFGLSSELSNWISASLRPRLMHS